jgi:hypothetical protein
LTPQRRHARIELVCAAEGREALVERIESRSDLPTLEHGEA